MLFEPAFHAGTALAQEPYGKRNFVGVNRRPGDKALQFGDVVLNGADLDQFFFYDLRVSHEQNLTRTRQ